MLDLKSKIKTVTAMVLLITAICSMHAVPSWCQVTFNTGGYYAGGGYNTCDYAFGNYTTNQILEVGPHSCVVANVLYPPSTSEVVGNINVLGARSECTNYKKITNYWWGWRNNYNGYIYYSSYDHQSADHIEKMVFNFSTVPDDQEHTLTVDPVTWDAYVCVEPSYLDGWLVTSELSPYSDIAKITYKAAPIYVNLKNFNSVIVENSPANFGVFITPSGYDWDTYSWSLQFPFKSYEGESQKVWTGREYVVYGTSTSGSWDGRDSSGNLVPPGDYPVTLTVTPSQGRPPIVKTAIITVKGDCNLKITSFSGVSSPILDPSAGGSIPLTGTIFDDSGKPITWTMNVAGATYPGTGNAPSATWDGRDGSGKVVEPGEYSATLTAQTDGQCSDSSTISFTVEPPPDNSCGLYVDFGSSANVASGALAHSQDLFSTKSAGLTTSITLYYNSQDPHSASLGTGWSHSYDISFKQNSNGSVVLHEGNGNRKLYTMANGTYVSQQGNYTTLVKNSDGTFTITQKDSTKYNFTTGGQISSIVDRNGNTGSFVYSGGNLTTITDPAGRITTLTYDAANHLTTLTDPSGKNYTFIYSGTTLSSVTYPDNGTWRYTYDANAFMLTKTDPLGNTTTYTYDANHRVTSATDPQGQVRSVAYPAGTSTTKSTTFTEKDGGQWQYSYDTQAGTFTSKTDPQGGVNSYAYDTTGNRISTTLPDGSTTTSTYDVKGNMTSSTDALKQTTFYTYNTFGQVTNIKDPQGNITGYSYDANGNMASTTDPTGATTQYQYDSRGGVTKVTNAAGQATSFTYDTSGNLTAVTDAAGATTSYTYDAAGNMTSQTDASGAVTRFTYDVIGHLVALTDPQGNITTYTYDANGNKISQTDANGNTTSYTYNFKGQLISTIDSLGNVTTYVYGATGCPSCGGGTDKLTSIIDANTNSTSYQYDPLGRLLSETDPIGNVTSYTYDANGNLITKTDGNGATTKYSYDSLGRLLKKTYPDATTTMFTYDAKGRVLTAANQKTSYSFIYDANSNVLSATDSNGRHISYSYDTLGNKTKTVSPDGRTITYSYDKAGRLTGLLDGGNFTIGYDNLGRISSLAYPNGDKTTYSYDNAGRLLNLVQKNGGGSIIASNSYTLDQTANRLSNTTVDKTLSYQYDAIYHLTQALSNTSGNSGNTNGKGGGIPNATQQQKVFYSYDPVGNRLTSDKIMAYVYNQGNQLVVNGGSFSYDMNGNLIQKVTSDGTTNYAWDYENRLVKIVTPDGTIAEFTYNPFGKRIAKKVTQNGAATSTHYFYDNQAILFEYDDTGAIGNRYTHGPGIDEHLMVATGKDKYYYHADGLGSIIAMTDKSGIVGQTYEYDSFGNLKDQMNRVKQPFTYTGREWDKETGLYYYRARYYDPMEGRFISEDPIRMLGGINFYSYTLNNPINFTDPLGLIGFNCGSGIESLFIPDSWFGKYSFSSACESHDKCYDTPNKPKKTCDDNFDRNIKNECSTLSGLWKINCESIGASYVVAVRNLGNGAYCAAQKKAIK
jgi:RHS repeat-associated protein